MVVLVVVLLLAVGVGTAAWATHRNRDDVEPTVREFAEFRDAISRQVAGVQADTASTRHHLDSRTLHSAHSTPTPPRGAAGMVGGSAGTRPLQG